MNGYNYLNSGYFRDGLFKNMNGPDPNLVKLSLIGLDPNLVNPSTFQI